MLDFRASHVTITSGSRSGLLTFTSKAPEALAWPTVVLILGLVFRQKLLDLIPAIKKIKAGPVEAEFEVAAKKILAEAAEVASPANSSELASPLAPTSEPGRGLITNITKLRNARSDATGAITYPTGSYCALTFTHCLTATCLESTPLPEKCS